MEAREAAEKLLKEIMDFPLSYGLEEFVAQELLLREKQAWNQAVEACQDPFKAMPPTESWKKCYSCEDVVKILEELRRP